MADRAMTQCEAPLDEAWRARLDEDERVRQGVGVTPEVRSRWTRRLLQEWLGINHWRLRGAMRAPQIQVSDDMRRWGYWDPQRRLLAVSERQIACYTWASVLETLKHEMAHQYVTEVLGVHDEPAHGPAFRRMCRRLGADPAARAGGGAPLYGSGEEIVEAADPTLRRIRKLLALADSNPSEAEAQLAYRRANSLLLKYNLSLGDLAEERVHTFRRLGTPSGRVSSVHYSIGGILRDFFFVSVLWVQDYLALEDKEGRIIEVMGTPANVDMAEHVHATLLRILEDLWQAWARQSGAKGMRAKREYQEGALSGFRLSLKTGREEDRQEGLVWVGDPRLEQWANERWPNRRSVQVSGVLATDNHAAGMADGRNVRIHRPVGGGDSSRGRLIGA